MKKINYVKVIEEALMTVEREYKCIGRTVQIEVCQRVREEVNRRLMMQYTTLYNGVSNPSLSN